MDVRLLKYFLMVTREESISKAAEQLFITQPTLSRQLKQLEDELGVTLFNRGAKKIELTRDGLLLKRRAQEIVHFVEKTKQEFLQNEGELIGEISMGCNDIYNMKLLSQINKSFRDKHPLVKFTIYSGSSDFLKERMDLGLFDICMFLEPIDLSEYNFVRLPHKESWGIMVGEDSPLIQKESVSPKDLIGFPLLFPIREASQNELASWFGDYYSQIDIAATFNILSNTTDMVREKFGIVLCLRRQSTTRGLRFIPLSPKLETGAVLAWRKLQDYPPLMLQFIKHVNDFLRRK